MSKPTKIQPGTTPADPKYRVVATEKGPYLVHGTPPLAQTFLMPNEEGSIWYYAPGDSYLMKEPTALCRCGASKNKPYCDGAHINAAWDPTLTASDEPLLAGAEVSEGPTVSLSDNEAYCAFARFCDAKGRAWNLVGESDDPKARELTIREANMCPGGRLSAWDNGTDQPFEPQYDPSLMLIEDPMMHVSGPIWVRGGIRIEREDGSTYEIRNRVTLCRCGQSSNKPFCDSTHTTIKFHDGLNPHPKK